MFEVVGLLKLVGWVVALVSAVMAVGGVAYVVQKTYKPLLVAVQWVFAYTPGQPGEIHQGISYGARIVVWSAMIGLVVWFFLH